MPGGTSMNLVGDAQNRATWEPNQLIIFRKIEKLMWRARAYRFFSCFEKKSPTDGLFLEKALQENNNFDSGNRSPAKH